MKVRVTSSGAYRAINGSATTIRAVDESFGVVSGAANLSFTASGAISGITLAPVSGSANLSFTASGSITAVAPVSGRADLSFTAAGALSGIGYVSGRADLAFTTAGSIVAYVPISGRADLAFSAAGSIAGLRYVSGRADLSFSASGALSALAPVSGHANLSFTASGSLVGLTDPKLYDKFEAVYTARSTLLNAILTAGMTREEAAQQAADAAKAQAAAALARLDDIAADGKLTLDEQKRAKPDYDTIIDQQAGLDATATSYGITTEKTAYDNAVTALKDYLRFCGGASGVLDASFAWVGAGGTLSISRTDWDYRWNSVYTSKQALLNKIVDAAKALANSAQGTADAAQGAADAAKAQAAAALARLDDIAADGKLTLDEQKRAKPDYDTIIDQQAGLDATATSYGITAEKTAYDNSVTALKDYLRFCGGASGVLDASFAWVGAGGTLSISRTDWDYRWNSVYTSKQALLNKIVDAAKALANSAQGTADAAQGAADSAQQAADAANQANAVVNPKFTADLGSWTFDTAGAGEWHRETGGNSPDASVPTYLVHQGMAGQAVTVARNTGGGLSVNPGQGVTATVALRSLSANTGAHAYVRIGWYNSAGTEIGNSTNGVTVCPTNFVQGVSRVYGTAPPNAARAVAEVEFDGHTSGYFSITAACIAALPGNLDEVPDSSTWAKIRSSELTDGRHNLGIGSSGARLGGLRNQVMVGVGNYGAGWSGGTITYSASSTSATITASAASLQVGGTSLAYNQSSVTVGGSAGSTHTYYLYYDDDDYTGGSKTLNATTSQITALAADGRVFVGQVPVTFPTSGTSSGGGGTGCPQVDEPVIRRAYDGTGETIRSGDVRVGDYILSPRGRWLLVTYSEPKRQPCVRVTLEDGESRVFSATAPLEDARGRAVLAPQAEGCVLYHHRAGSMRVVGANDAGEQWIQHITAENDYFLVGNFSHHNLKPVPNP